MAKKFKRGQPSKDALSNSLGDVLKKGAGVNAVFGERQVQETLAKPTAEAVSTLSRNFAMLPLDKIFPNPDQPRKEFEQEPLDELTDSIRAHGIIQPITVRHMGDGSYQIISGERRYRASKAAELTEVPAFIRTANDQTLLEMALIENVLRQDLNPMEIAYSYLRLKQEFKLTQKELSDRVGIKRSTVANYLGILETSPMVQEAIKNNQLTIGAAKAFAGIKDKQLQELFLKDILDHPEWSIRKIEQEAKSYKEKTKVSKNRQPSNDELKEVKQAFQAFFGTKQIKIDLEDKDAKSGSITIKFKNQEELEGFYKSVE
ncbi:ParB/RepB/Spo0J family partition protein [Lewinella sp. W8]|uniref:ParB/RepB/Spo0J family partition protein n=1 Tax=Lewinella sp. W8 TaxID=2528208 RepID=UPI0010676CBF|nr:ParB/RepB/Spo0J family partition protein [Lewinella sp. W8]MTB51263.1 ParB/RepB/Spo0J family partition protein [Lewinella sp. W8]